MKAYINGINTPLGNHDYLDVIALRVTIYEDGHTAWYPVNINQIASESILDSHNIDIYWDWLEYNGNHYGDYPELENPFPDNVL